MHVQHCEDYTGKDQFHFPVFVLTTVSQFVLKSISAQQASPPYTRHSLVVLMVMSNHAITPMNFQSPLVKHALIYADMIVGTTARD